ncbi:sigma-70 family RNA polymerase sigma factor [Streptomyces sp. SBST2-5]|uniref:RNA polymerase sigma factor n=1 Tax=Streptomyces composti TaxID=2720025 RepID=A0ABX0ZYF3_9ACTN|nr:sigma-70 family RNA polymerase sigma factor [Streptomyces composti]NJP49113.1 sigma-70 family RNA polymerase sigma factor [Streptomyces composti]
MAASGDMGAAVVEAARSGDQRAQDQLVAGCLPLVYNIVGRALNGHPDVDDVVQETMLRALRSLGSLADPAKFRSWLVAITMNQIRHHWRDGRTVPAGQELHDAHDVADPGADFVDLTIIRLGLQGQRREVAEATRWLDPDDQALLSLWWLEAAGELTRAEVAAALELSPQHTAVRVQRMKAQLETARLVVRALAAQPRCVLLDDVVGIWDGTPSALWRKRIARHARDCTRCAGFQADLAPAEGLLVGLGLVPVAGLLGGALAGFAGGAADAAPMAFAADAGASRPAFTTDAGATQPIPAAGGGPGYGDHGFPGGPVDVDAPTTAVPRAHGAPGPEAPTPAAGIGAGAGPRTSRRARTRQRRRRNRTVAAAAVALLVAGGTVGGITILTPEDKDGTTVQSAPEGVEPSATSGTDTVTPSPSPSASPSAGPSRKPSVSASPKPSTSPRKTTVARATQPERTRTAQQQPRKKPSTTAQAAPAGSPAAQVLALTNAERSKAGCGPVTADSRLAKAAQLHSEDMSANNYFSHTSQDGRSFVDRAKAQGYPSPGAENIAKGQSSAAAVMDAWMNSPGHRANILNCDLKTMGVGVTTDDWTWTQVFGF